MFFKIYIFSCIVFFYIFSAKRLQKSARNRHKCQFFMEKIYPWNSPMCFQVLLYCFQLVTEYIWHRNIWFLLSLLCFKMRWNPFWNLILFFPNMSTKLKNSFLKTKERRNEKVVIFKKWYFVTKIVLTYCEKKMF